MTGPRYTVRQMLSGLYDASVLIDEARDALQEEPPQFGVAAQKLTEAVSIVNSSKRGSTALAGALEQPVTAFHHRRPVARSKA